MKINLEIRPILSAMLRSRTAPLLVAAQIAISLALLINALYVIDLRLAVASRPIGMANEAALFNVVFKVPPRENNEQLAAQQREIAAIRAVPGVISAARIGLSPLNGFGLPTSVVVDYKQNHSLAEVAVYRSPDSLVQTWGLKLVEGRDFNADELRAAEQDMAAFTPNVIITQALARKLYPAETSVTGKPFYFGTGNNARGVQIIGVVERLQTYQGEVGDQGEYSVVTLSRFNGPYSRYTVQALPGQVDRVMEDVKLALSKTFSTPVALYSRTIAEDRAIRYRNENMLAWILIAVSILLVIITASGIVGISSLWVAQRRKQIGVRRALGACKADILRYFITENFLITAAGIAAGILLALGLNQFLVNQFELTRLPMMYFVVAPLIFWGLGVIAVFAPAWRAASISPAIATRSV